MSRLIVKNLPAYLTQQKLRVYFEGKDGPGGTLTDVKLVLRPDGTSRRFGFVGYKTPTDAERAKKWFDRTFVDSSRISVEIVDDAPPPRPNKRPRLGPSPSEEAVVDSSTKVTTGKSTTKKTKTEAISKGKNKADDAQLDEFMQIMQPRTKKGPSWANEDATPLASTTTGIPVSASTSKKLTLKSKAVDTTNNGLEDGTQPSHTDTGLSDTDWLKRHTKQAIEESEDAVPEKAFSQSDGEGEVEAMDEVDDASAAEQADESFEDPTNATILQTGRLFLRNLSFACTETELQELFEQFGEVSQVHIPLDPTTKQPKGLAYVSFAKPTSALAAFEALDKSSFQGRLLHILPAVDRRAKTEESTDGKRKTLKQEKDTKRKTGAGREFNWAMLYMNSDAVASSIADRMNIPKSEILNPESDNAAVKLALAETHIINETKSFLESHGVILSALSPTAHPKRSDTTILVKNIPYGTSADTLRGMFSTYGELRRVLVPPAGTLAVIEYVHVADARNAFRGLAYRRLGNSVMYLEKAPLGMLAEGPADADAVVADGVAPVTDPNAPLEAAAQADGEEPALSAGTTLFVKNLAFSTTSAGLVQAVRHLSGFAFARVQTKVDPARPAARLSMGYGFVGFRTKEEAKRAMRGLEGFVLEGHALSVKWAGRGTEDEGGEQKGKPKTAKMVVKNLPFEATKKDVRELFGSQGQLKSVRLPRKFDRRTRGFAFLEFVSPHEAARAYAALRHTHLLGRHLVLEWAEDGDVDIDELRRKAGVGLGDGKEMPGRKRKIAFSEGDEAGVDGMDD
ncbi:hypothetical protein B0H21DRAFT_810303 [Amylocystis lapponica]|nr:hypothetical protein B0H21DRAFT_810303 [Amylocystis lapponica]